jgi:outer membrane protein assembly factor BamB
MARTGSQRPLQRDGLLKEWPKDGPPLAWKVNGLGGGDSGPAIAAGRIYGMSHRGSDEIVWALSEKDGKEIWAVRIAPAQRQTWPQSKEGPSATPTVDGDRLYVMGLAGNVACLQVADGKVVGNEISWQISKGAVPMWSFRESPLVDGDKLICTPGGEEATMVALNKRTGETIWKSQVPGPRQWESDAKPRLWWRKSPERDANRFRAFGSRQGSEQRDFNR